MATSIQGLFRVDTLKCCAADRRYESTDSTQARWESYSKTNLRTFCKSHNSSGDEVSTVTRLRRVYLILWPLSLERPDATAFTVLTSSPQRSTFARAS